MNVQKLIIEGVKERLFFNDYLVLPDFGGFVLKSRPSHFATSGLTLHPPSKTVTFNAQLRQNDGILVLWLQGKLGCTSTEALSHLKDFAAYCSGVLSTRKRLSIEGIGFFYLDFENNVCFEPQQDINFLSSSYGLGPLNVKVLEQPTIEPKKEPVFVDRKPELPLKSEMVVKQKRNYRKLVLPLLIMLLFFSGLLLFVSNTKMSGELRSAIFGSETTKIKYTPLPYPEMTLTAPATENNTYVSDANGIATLKLDEDKTVSLKAVEKSLAATGINGNVAAESSNLRSRQNNFEIVLGCFTVFHNAKKMVGKLLSKNIKAGISGKNYKGMHVVSIANFGSKEEALSYLNKIKDNCPNAWIKKPE